MTVDRCRVCGRTPDDIVRAASVMRRLVDARYIGSVLRTTWRATIGNKRDYMCGICQRETARAYGLVL